MKIYRIKHKPTGLYWNKLKGRLVDDGLRDAGVMWKEPPTIPEQVTIITKHQDGKSCFVFARYPASEFELLYDEIKD